MEGITLPLYDLFDRLREHGLPLGISEYIALLRSLQTGIGLSDQDSLRRLCKSLWVSSEEDSVLFDRLFDQVFIQSDRLGSSEESVKSPKESEETAAEAQATGQSDLSAQTPAQVGAARNPSLQVKTGDLSPIVQSIRRGQRNINWDRPKYNLLTEYFPVTHRQMKQSSRYLRRPVREGPAIELDIDATVEKISREGLFREPVLVPRRLNRAELVLLVDQGGSMVPFHALSRQLIDAVHRGGLMQQTNVYYFHDYPAEYLYTDRSRLTARSVLDVFMSFDQYTALLIVSDGGAARGNFDEERVKQTNVFIQKLKQYARRFAWINPLPNFRWPDTSAEQIARNVPMFDMSRRGLDDAINTLRGRYVYGEKSYAWMK